MGPILERSNIADATLRSAFFWVGNLLTPVRLWPFFSKKTQRDRRRALVMPPTETMTLMKNLRMISKKWRTWEGHFFPQQKGRKLRYLGGPELGLCWRFFGTKNISRSKSPNLSKHGLRKDFDEIRIVGFVLHTRSCVLDFGFLFILVSLQLHVVESRWRTTPVPSSVASCFGAMMNQD